MLGVRHGPYLDAGGAVSIDPGMKDPSPHRTPVAIPVPSRGIILYTCTVCKWHFEAKDENAGWTAFYKHRCDEFRQRVDKKPSSRQI